MRSKHEDNEKDINALFARLTHQMSDKEDAIVLIEKGHNASSRCWCKPIKNEDGVYTHKRRDN